MEFTALDVRRMKKEIVSYRQKIQDCKQKADDAEELEECSDKIGKELQADWVDAEVTVEVNENDIDAANAIIPSLEQRIPIKEVEEELTEWLLQRGTRTVDRGIFLNRKLLQLMEAEEKRKEQLRFFTQLKHDSMEEVQEWQTEMESIFRRRVRQFPVILAEKFLNS